MTRFSTANFSSRTSLRKIPSLIFSVSFFLSLLFSSCGFSQRGVRLFLSEPFPKKLSSWHLFTSNSKGLTPNAGVLAYDLNTPLFSDYASKYRFVWMPTGSSASYREDTTFDFPVGTILAKSFAFPVDNHSGKEKLIETRLLVNTNSGWVALPYVWNDRQTEATLQLVPDPVPVRFTDAEGHPQNFTYQIPNANECRQCHDREKTLQPIGPKARNLNKIYSYLDGSANQLARWTQVGYLRGAPSAADAPRAPVWNDPTSGSLEQRALAYLDNNCAHCHQPAGTAGYTGVDFRLSHFDPAHAGFCKHPNSAGNMGNRHYDIVPGDPEDSILLYRLASTAPKVMMPQIGRATVHSEGLALLHAWIASLSPQSCGPR
jgi:uncharacterized repeat protein (TIGR03806 family)